MITDGFTSANINKSKYLIIIDDGSAGVEDDDFDSVVVLAAFWSLNPELNDDVPIRKETIVRTFCVRPRMITTGARLGLFVVVFAAAVVLSEYYCPCTSE